ncbi:DUF4139 domain-containing protein, partial [Verrucomicrobia bacterium]|nr:DUF4139 domain-containing protein [Verrucomicrobiota bacterium]
MIEKRISENLIGSWIGKILIVSGLAVSSSCIAAGIPKAESRIERVALFKNGMGYFNSLVKLPENSTTVELGQFPVASHGTFWVNYPEQLAVKSLVTRMETVPVAIPIKSLSSLLQSNVGRKVSILTSSKELSTIKGTILSFLSEDQSKEPSSPYVMDLQSMKPPRRDSFFSAQAEASETMVLLQTSGGIAAINTSSILNVLFDDEDVSTFATEIFKQPAVRMELNQPSQGETVEVNYLARGITWVPSYRIDLTHTNMATFSAKALVINEVADLKNIQLELVTGFPHIAFGDVSSPVAMKEKLKSFILTLDKVANKKDHSADGFQPSGQQGGGRLWSEQNTALIPGYSTAQLGTISADLFLYPVESFSLARGEIAYVPLFTVKLPYKEIYTWDIPDIMDGEARFTREALKAK